MKIEPSNHEVSRREFLKHSSKLGLLCGFACMCPHVVSKLQAEEADAAGTSIVPDPKKLNYCGYVCPENCPMKAAGESTDIEQKRNAYNEWRIKERYGLEFDPDQILCNGCKTDKAQLGMTVSNCPVRQCVIEKELDCCIQCDDLATCDKALWKEFPPFREHVLKMQEQYRRSLS